MNATRETRAAFRIRLAVGSSLIALAVGGSAHAQSTAVEEVIVTGSRVIRNGDAAPTPLTVVGVAQLKDLAPANLPDALNKLPQFLGSSRPANAGPAANGNNGGNFLSLRGLGPTRTLTLLDGRRAPPSNTSGAADINTFPQGLVSRVDVVTGGASAAYGSDAVAGVVNFVLDTKFEGLKGEINAGISKYDDNGSWKASLSGGKSFADGRGRIIGGYDHYRTNAWATSNNSRGRKWIDAGTGLIPNAAGQTPATLLTDNVKIIIGTFNGVVVSGPLLGTQFDINGNQTTPFQYGGTRTTNTTVGGDGTYQISALPAALRSDSAFTHAEYDLTDSMTAFVEAGWSESISRYVSTYSSQSGTGQGFTIRNDNFYLPAATRAEMAARNLTTITLGRISRNFGLPNFHNLTQNLSFLGGLKGDVGKFNYEGYYQHNVSFVRTQTRLDEKLENTYNASDVVANPAVGGVAGVAAGQPVCRSTLTSPGNGCVPVNPFGERPLTAAQQAYVTGTAYSRQKLVADVAAFRISGDLFELWAGPVSFATGVEYRTYDVAQVVDSLSVATVTGAGFFGFPSALINGVGGYQLTNSKPAAGSYNVKEAFAEVALPLARDAPFAHALDVNAAIRYADYSTSGGVVPWKVGATWAPIQDLRFRGTISKDIRAPNFIELFSGSVQGQGFLNDFRVNNQPQFAKNYRIGNPALTPETADTFTAGVVFQPSFVPGFSASFDVYKIDIKDAINLLGAQTVLDECGKGVASQCLLVERNAAGVLQSVTSPYQNVAAFKVNGFDIEAGYRTDFAGGTLALRALLNHTGKLETKVGAAAAVDRAGDLRQSLNGVPEWTGLLSAAYDNDRWGASVQQRYLSSGKLDHLQTTYNINKVPAVYYTTITGKYKFEAFGSKSEFYVTVDNLFDRDPPRAPNMTTVTFYPTNTSLYDQVGRYYTAGVRFQF